MKKLILSFADSRLSKEQMKGLRGGVNDQDEEPSDEEGGGGGTCISKSCSKTTYNMATGQWVTTNRKCNSSTYQTTANGQTYTHCLYVCPLEGAGGCY